MLAIASEPILSLADTAMIGRLGVEPLAARAIASALIGGIYWVFSFLIFGTTTLVGYQGKPSTKSDWESVLQLAPEVIVLMPCGFNIERILKEVHLLYQLPGWDELPAVKENRVFAVNGHAYFNRSGPRLVDGLEILGQIIHPEIFSWKAPPEAARRLN